MVHRWCRQFSEGRQSVHDEERSGRPSIISSDVVEFVRQRVLENRRFTIMEPSSRFPQMSRSLLHDIVTKHLMFKKLFKKIKKIEDVCHTLVPFTGGRVIPQSDTKVYPTIRQMSQFWC
ncbi:uncharacterized protein TNCV_4405641 [Trichonephila clavipes]|uniref:Uncharacterized protein n=1 Tax=Trichonephila clavipes TaxID=2585209 RepID=A0A8X6VAY8_TRICX|nr:uncharacterized protein TNCV_4405641 [Trichonephila clavipes]